MTTPFPICGMRIGTKIVSVSPSGLVFVGNVGANAYFSKGNCYFLFNVSLILAIIPVDCDNITHQMHCRDF